MAGNPKQIEEIIAVQGIIEAVGDAISIQDTDFRVLYQNRIHKNIVGDCAGDYCYAAYHGRNQVCEECHLAMTFRDGNVYTFEHERGADQEKKYYEITSSPIRGSKGEIIAGIEFVREITERKKIEEALKESRKKYGDFVNNAVTGVFKTNLKGDILFVNRAMARMIGYKSPNQMIKHDVKFRYKDVNDRNRMIDTLLREGRLASYEIDIVTDTGKVKNMLMDARIDGEFISGMMSDVTDLKNAEQELRKFKFISDNSSDAHFIVGSDAMFKYVNKTACNILGYSQEELLVLGVYDVDIEYDLIKYKKLFNLIQQESVPPIETVNKRKNGSLFPSEITVTGYHLSGKPYMFAVLRDITERKRQEEVLLNIAKGVSAEVGEQFFYSMAEHLVSILKADYGYVAELIQGKPNYVRTLSLVEDGKILDNIEVDLKGTPCETVLNNNICSYPSEVQSLFPHAQMMTQMNIDGYVGKLLYSSKRERLGIMAVMYKKTVENVVFVESTLRIFAARTAAEIERRQHEKVLRKSKDELEIRVKERTLELERANEELNNKIAKIEATQIALQTSNERFRSVVSLTSDLLWEGNIETDSLIWFGDVDGYLGYELGEFSRTISGFNEYVHPEDCDMLNKAVARALKTGEIFYAEFRIRCKDGTYRYWEERCKPAELKNGNAVKWIGTVTDITDRKQAEDSLRASEEKYKGLTQEFNALIDGITDNIILLTPELKIIWANKSFASKYGGKITDIIGRHCYNMCCKIASPCKKCPAKKSLISGKEEATRVMSKEGRIYDKRAFPIMDEEGNVKNVIEIGRDITASVHMEEEAKLVQQRLIHANKMTSLGTLVSGVAHEINNPNSFALNNAQVLNEIWNDTVKILVREYRKNKTLSLAGIPFAEIKKVVPKMLYGISDGSLRIKHIVDNLRDFSRQEKSSLDGNIDINRVIMTSVSMLDNHIKKHTRKFRIKCAEDLPIVKGSSQQIEQVVINLIMNALQALPDRNAGIEISILNNSKTNTVDIKVKDEGCGISRDNIDSVTEPFFTTRLDAGGTGLGLSISYAIIKEHGGTLKIRSKEGRGTIITIKLPYSAEHE